jgi:hypothetical protein
MMSNVDLNAAKDGNLATSDELRVNYVDHVVPNVLIEYTRDLSCRGLSRCNTLFVVPDYFFDVLHLGIVAKRVNDGLLYLILYGLIGTDGCTASN